MTIRDSFRLDLRAGEFVEVRSKEEILATLGEDGRLDGMPFMPEMLAFCGQRFKVASRADKTCMYNKGFSLRRLSDAVHLEHARCDGAAHGGCQASCFIYWKEAWLKRAGSSDETASAQRPPRSRCTEGDLVKASRKATSAGDEPLYACQATELAHFTAHLPWWDFRHFVKDLRSGHLASGFARLKSERLLETVLVVWQVIRAALLLAFNNMQNRRRCHSYPPVSGPLKKTPTRSLGLQAGDIVQVKTRTEILATLDQHNRNRGMFFDGEMLEHCGRLFRVKKRVERIIDDKTGRMLAMANDCIMLEGAVCRGEFHGLCPRAIYPYWREVWLEKAGTSDKSQPIADEEPAAVA